MPTATGGAVDAPERTRPWALAFLWRFALTLGLTAGIVEVGLVIGHRTVRGTFLHLGRDFVWMAPASEAVLLMGVAGIFGLGLVWIPWHRLEPVAVRVLTTLAVICAVLAIGPLHWLAAVILGAGIGHQFGQLLLKRPGAVAVVARAGLPLILVVITVAIVTVNGPWGRDRARATVAPSRSGPNVLFITLDTVAASHLSLYGYERPTTPFLKRFASESVVFDRAIAQAPWTLPSHASMFVGHDPHELSANWLTPLDATYPTLAEIMSAHGYRTGGFVANTIYCSYEFGLDRGFQHFEDFDRSPGEFVVSSALGRRLSTSTLLRGIVGSHDVLGRKSAARINQSFLRWLEARPGVPFFAWLNVFDAHEPYFPPEPYKSRFDRGHARHVDQISQRVNSAERPSKWLMPADEVQAEIDAYDGALAYLDAQLEVLMRALTERGLLDNTVIILTADHGEEFGEHGVFTHGNSVYLQVVHVPLVIRLPRASAAGTRVPGAVGLDRLAATVADLGLGQAVGIFPGASLRGTWSGVAGQSDVFSELGPVDTAPAWYRVAHGPVTSVVRGDLHYLQWGDGVEELFDLARDPGERTNMAADPAQRDSLELLRMAVRRHTGR